MVADMAHTHRMELIMLMTMRIIITINYICNMLNSKQLDRCVNILDSIKDTLKDRESLEGILEVIYFLKKERDVVIVEESWANRTVDPNLLKRDNIQLVNENIKLKEDNGKLIKIVESKLPHIFNSIENITKGIETIHKISEQN